MLDTWKKLRVPFVAPYFTIFDGTRPFTKRDMAGIVKARKICSRYAGPCVVITSGGKVVGIAVDQDSIAQACRVAIDQLEEHYAKGWRRRRGFVATLTEPPISIQRSYLFGAGANAIVLPRGIPDNDAHDAEQNFIDDWLGNFHNPRRIAALAIRNL